MTVYETLNRDDKLTEEQIAMLRELEASPAVPDEDCPELTDEQIASFSAAAEKRRRKMRKETVDKNEVKNIGYKTRGYYRHI